MDSHEHLLYDTGRIPFWLRLPCAAAGVFLLWISAHVLSSHLFGFALGLHFKNESGSPVIGFLATLALGLFLLSTWFLRNRIYLDASGKEIVVRHAGLFGRSVRRIQLSDAAGVSVRPGKIRGGAFWDISIELKNGRQEWLTRVYLNNDKDAIVRTFAQDARLATI